MTEPEQGDVEAIRDALLQRRPGEDKAKMALAALDRLAAVDRLAAALERAEQERDDAIREYEQSDAWHWKARAEKAERALAKAINERDDLAEHLAYLLEHGHLDETGKRHVAAVLVRHAFALRPPEVSP